MDFLVIGCGVSGLTTGLCLLEAGHTVSIWARELPPFTTSNIAAAIWLPYKAYPAERVTVWSKESMRKFKVLQSDEESGIFMASFLEVKPVPTTDPLWVTVVDGFRHARKDELPPGYLDGYTFEAPVIDTLVYLDYLMHTYEGRKGQIIQRAITSLTEAFAQSDIVVNCTGLGARELVGDYDLRPAKGQVVRIKHNAFRRVLLDEEGPNGLAYIIPRTHDIVLGGTYEEQNESLEVDADETQAIVRRCRNLAPEFPIVTPEDITSVICGLRPVRSTVRVEAERISPDRLLVHNYGHGGAGITLSWGCATEVVQLISEMAVAQ
jgi:D-amino-acid oxidase